MLNPGPGGPRAFSLNSLRCVTVLLGALLLPGIPAAARAQSEASAVRKIDFSAFGGITGVYTGLDGGRNLSITAGADLNLPEVYRVRPVVEVRGTAAVDSGVVDGQKDVLGGLRAEFRFRRLHPYADFLVGRGELDYVIPFVNANETLVYQQTPSTVLSPGVGVRLELAGRFSLLADGQFQRWKTPVVASGTIYAKPLTLGLSYRLTFPHRGRPDGNR